MQPKPLSCQSQENNNTHLIQRYVSNTREEGSYSPQVSKQRYRVQRPIQQFNRPTGDLGFSQNPISYKHQVIALSQSTIVTFGILEIHLWGFVGWLRSPNVVDGTSDKNPFPQPGATTTSIQVSAPSRLILTNSNCNNPYWLPTLSQFVLWLREGLSHSFEFCQICRNVSYFVTKFITFSSHYW